MIEHLKRISFWLAIAVLIFCAWFFWLKGCQYTFLSRDDKAQTIIIHDTTTIDRYNETVKRDTVIKWYAKIVEKKVDAEKIYVQKVDTVFIEKTKDLDVMLSVKKKGNDLDIFAINQNGKILKQYTYKNIGNGFTATSTVGNVFVKTKLFYWNGLAVLGGYELKIKKSVKLKDGLPYVGIKSGVNYLQIIDLTGSVNYDIFNREPYINTELKYYFFK